MSDLASSPDGRDLLAERRKRRLAQASGDRARQLLRRVLPVLRRFAVAAEICGDGEPTALVAEIEKELDEYIKEVLR